MSKNGVLTVFFSNKENNPISVAIADHYLGHNFPDLIDFYYYDYSLVQFQLSHCAIKKPMCTLNKISPKSGKKVCSF